MPDIFDDIERLHDQMRRRLVRQVYLATHPAGFLPERSWEPPLDVYQTEDAILVVMEVAGVELSDVDVVVDRQILTVSGIRREQGERNRVYMQMEIRYGPFERRIRLPGSVDTGKVSAVMKNGFLRIHMPVSARSEHGTITVVPITVE